MTILHMEYFSPGRIKEAPCQEGSRFPGLNHSIDVIVCFYSCQEFDEMARDFSEPRYQLRRTSSV